MPRARATKARKIFEQAAQRLNFEWEVIPPPESAADAQAAIAAIAGDGEYYAVHLPDRTAGGPRHSDAPIDTLTPDPSKLLR